MVTAEAAIAVGALVAATLLLISVLSLVAVHLRLGDAARVAARAAARGDAADQVVGAAHRSAPAAAVTVAGEGDQVRVVVTEQVQLPLLRLWALSVDAEAVAPREASPP
jgi:hypothetical protein